MPVGSDVSRGGDIFQWMDGPSGTKPCLTSNGPTAELPGTQETALTSEKGWNPSVPLWQELKQ